MNKLWSAVSGYSLIPFVIAWFAGAFIWPAALTSWSGAALVLSSLIWSAMVIRHGSSEKPETFTRANWAVYTALIFPGIFGLALWPYFALRSTVKYGIEGPTQVAIIGLAALFAGVGFVGTWTQLGPIRTSEDEQSERQESLKKKIAEGACEGAMESIAESLLRRFAGFIRELF